MIIRMSRKTIKMSIMCALLSSITMVGCETPEQSSLKGMSHSDRSYALSPEYAMERADETRGE
jgi:hypothetical protein